MVADHAPESGWSGEDLEGYLEGLGPARAADFLEELAAAAAEMVARTTPPTNRESGAARTFGEFRRRLANDVRVWRCSHTLKEAH